MENKNLTRTKEKKTLGLAYITREVLQKGEELPFFYKRRPRSLICLSLRPIDWTKKVGQIYYKLSYSPNYPNLEDSVDLLVMRSADRSDRQDEYLPQIRLADFGEGKDKLFLSFDRERMYDDDIVGSAFFGRDDSGKHDRKQLELLSEKQEHFCTQIPGSGKCTSPKRFISTAKGALTYQEDFYSDLRKIYIDQKGIPFAGLRRLMVKEYDDYYDTGPEFDFVAYKLNGKKWGKRIGNLEYGFHFREKGKIKTLNWHDVAMKIHEGENPCKKCLSDEVTQKNVHYESVRLPGYENKGIVLEEKRAYEIEMRPTKKSIEITGLRELPFKKLTHIAPISSQKINDTLLNWATNPQNNPYRDQENWICEASQD